MHWRIVTPRHIPAASGGVAKRGRDSCTVSTWVGAGGRAGGRARTCVLVFSCAWNLDLSRYLRLSKIPMVHRLHHHRRSSTVTATIAHTPGLPGAGWRPAPALCTPAAHSPCGGTTTTLRGSRIQAVVCGACGTRRARGRQAGRAVARLRAAPPGGDAAAESAPAAAPQRNLSGRWRDAAPGPWEIAVPARTCCESAARRVCQPLDRDARPAQSNPTPSPVCARVLLSAGVAWTCVDVTKFTTNFCSFTRTILLG
jgi:hypothetical protein